jgi:hypothetical protein
MTEPRRARPGELPKFGSVWSWTTEGPRRMALGLRKKPSSWGEAYYLTAVILGAKPWVEDDMQWSMQAHVGMGAVLDGWFCWDEGET